MILQIKKTIKKIYELELNKNISLVKKINKQADLHDSLFKKFDTLNNKDYHYYSDIYIFMHRTINIYGYNKFYLM